jgi:hypothetical protein
MKVPRDNKQNTPKAQPAAIREATHQQQPFAMSSHPVIQKKTIGVFTKKETPSISGIPAETIQMMRYKNIKTGFSFSINDDGRNISAIAMKAPEAPSIFKKAPPRHQGYLRYSTTKDSLVIEHIENVPEEGSGLGPLLIQLAAQKAAQLNKPTISVVGLRYPEYYARWGFDIETPRERTRQQYRDAKREDEIPKVIGVPQADSTPAHIQSKTSPWVTKTWVDEWAETAKTAKDKTTRTEFPRIED